MDAPKTGKTGRPEYVPSQKERETVKALAGMGNSTDDIAEFVGITAPTLRKHFYMELQQGRSQGRVRNTKRLQDMAAKGNVTAMIWLDKTRYGIRENDQPGKKEQQAENARTAHEGTAWDGLLRSAQVQ